MGFRDMTHMHMHMHMHMHAHAHAHAHALPHPTITGAPMLCVGMADLSIMVDQLTYKKLKTLFGFE